MSVNGSPGTAYRVAMPSATRWYPVDSWPLTREQKIELAKAALPALMELWEESGLPRTAQRLAILVYAPGETWLGDDRLPDEHLDHALHIRAQGKQPAVVTLTSHPTGAEDLVVTWVQPQP